MTSDSFLAWVLALLGDEEKADATAGCALRRAKADKTGLSEVFAHLFSATKCLYLDQLEEAELHARTAHRGAEAMEFGQWANQANMQLARLADLRGEPGALDALRAGIENYTKRGMMLAHPDAQVWLAEAHLRRDEPVRALAGLDDLEDFAVRTQERFFHAQAQAARRLAEDRLSGPVSISSGG